MAFKTYVILGLLIAIILWRSLHHWLFARITKRLKGHGIFIIDKLTYYIGLLSLIALALKLIGVALGDILATAGVLTLAIGFASKTSISHLISGFILLGTKLIQKGDLIKVGPYTGIIEDIDVFATRLRTFDNILISLPNEKLLNEYVSNYSQYPVRRVCCERVLRSSDLTPELLHTLKTAVKTLPLLMVEPEPTIALSDLPGKGILVSARAWCETAQFVQARNELLLEVSRVLRELEVKSDSEIISPLSDQSNT